MQHTPSRRSLLALTASATIGGIAGCLDDDETQDGADATDDSDGTADQPADQDDDAAITDIDPASPQVAFRDWLTDPDAIDTTRFEYNEALLEQTTVGRADVLDLDIADVDAFLIQLPAYIIFGDFDVSRLETTLDSADEYQLTGEYESYRRAEPLDTDDSGDGLIESQFALSSDTILIGRDLDRWIDTKNGAADRLADTYPVFNDLFERLPDRTNVAGQVGPPPTWDVDGIVAWGSSSPSLDPGAVTSTWVYAFEEQPTSEQTEAVEENLPDPLIESIDQTATDGRFFTVTGTIRIPDTEDQSDGIDR